MGMQPPSFHGTSRGRHGQASASFPCFPEGAVHEVLAAYQGRILHFSSVPHSLEDDTGLESSLVLSMGIPRPKDEVVEIEEMEWMGDENVEAADGEDDVEEAVVGTDEVSGIDDAKDEAAD